MVQILIKDAFRDALSETFSEFENFIKENFEIFVRKGQKSPVG
jgi:hypothetical protein